MSLRAILLFLLCANLAFFAWARFIDVAPEPPQNDGISHLPRLRLLSEVKAPRQSAPKPPPAATGAPATNLPATNPPAIGAPPSPISASAPNPPTASRDPAGAQTAPGGGSRCVTVGPFSDPIMVGEAAGLLQQRGFKPRDRVEQSASAAVQSYWVYIGGLKSQSAQANALQRLERNGVSDAHAMPVSHEEERRVSVGLFSKRNDAERRARTVRSLGLDVQIEEQHHPEAASWIDVDLDSSTQALPTEGLLSLEGGGSRLEIQACPPAAKSAGTGASPDEPGAIGQPTSPASKPQMTKPLTAQGLQPD